MARRPDSAAPSTRHPSQLLALAIGAVYTLIGILGFLVTGFDNFAAETNKTLLGFEINPLHNLVHLAIGLAGLAMWRRLDTARTYGWLLAAGYGLAFIYGLFAAGKPDQVKLLLHMGQKDLGWDVIKLARRFGVSRPPPRSIVTRALGSSEPAPTMPRGR